jgi:Ca2+-binding RTX toxin-like protein
MKALDRTVARKLARVFLIAAALTFSHNISLASTAPINDPALALALRIEDQNVVVSWFGANAVPYELETSSNLTAWTIVTSTITGTGTTLSVTNPVAGQSQAFYRVRRLFPASEGSAVFDPATGLLTIIGDDEDNTIVVSFNAGTIVVNGGAMPILGGVATVANTLLIQVLGLGGDDQITISSANPPPPAHLFGGTGNDTLIGGSGADVLAGGPGNDSLHGQIGSDRLYGEEGNDTFQWDPGETSDVIEGGDGQDTLLFNGANIGENIDLSAIGTRLRFTRNIGTVVMDVDGVERVDFNAFGGADNIAVNNLTGTAVTQVNVNLPGLGGVGDSLTDTVTLNGTAGPDTFNFVADSGAVVATGLGPEVRVINGELNFDQIVVNGVGGDLVNVNGSAAADTMSVVPNGGFARVDATGFTTSVNLAGALKLSINGLGGPDTIIGQNGLATLGIQIQFDGGDGNDTLLGGDGDDILLGGPGNDFIDGNRGSDTAYLGADQDTFQWDPGDGNDVVEGGDGQDTLLFNGANIGENIDLSAIGTRLRFTRSIGTVVMDVDGVERTDFNALGGTDNILINNLAGTAVTQVNLNLANYVGAGDSESDAVTINGTTGPDTFNVAMDAGALAITGLGREIRVLHAENNFDRIVIDGVGDDLVNVNGSTNGDIMAIEPNGTFVRVTATGYSAPVDVIGELSLSVNGMNGTDTIVAAGDLAALGVPIQIDGGEGDDTLYGSNGADVLLGGSGQDVIDGLGGGDTVFLGSGDDTLFWFPGYGSTVIEGESGADTVVFNGSVAGENIDLSAADARLHLFCNNGNVTLDMDGVERVDCNALGGADNLVVNNLAGTSVSQVNIDLAATAGGATGDSQPDTITVNGTPNPDTINVTANVGTVAVFGLPALVWITHPEAAYDSLIVNGLGGVDTLIPGPGVSSQIALTLNQD